jgi:hypothetical protein
MILIRCCDDDMFCFACCLAAATIWEKERKALSSVGL